MHVVRVRGKESTENLDVKDPNNNDICINSVCLTRQEASEHGHTIWSSFPGHAALWAPRLPIHIHSPLVE